MKKILLLGGSAQQVIAIKVAKKLGYYTILCDYLDDNPGQYEADKFYLESTTDKYRILKIAYQENIDGIIAYASDPAAPTAAFVAEVMGLPTNPYNSVMTLCDKGQFRKFLKNSGFNCPLAKSFTIKDNIVNEINDFRLPVIIKPVDSSGSKGVKVLRELKDLNEAIVNAFAFSRKKEIIVEEYIERKHEYLIGGDIVISNGEVVIWGLLNCHRDNTVNDLVPVGKSYPLLMEENDIVYVKNTLNKLIHKLDLKFGSINVELIVDKNGNVWPIDVGPRAGGNMIPDLLGIIFNVNIVEMAIRFAMGEEFELDIDESDEFYATHNLHCNRKGIYCTIEFKDELEKYIIRKYLYKQNGDIVDYFDNASKALGIIFMRFSEKNDMFRILDNINDYYEVVLK